jgi:hypothetical protein
MKTNREERIARVYIGGNEYVNFTKETYLLFKKIVLCGIEQAKKNNEDLNKLMVMSSMGDVFLLSYAKYMVQYLDDFYKN